MFVSLQTHFATRSALSDAMEPVKLNLVVNNVHLVPASARVFEKKSSEPSFFFFLDCTIDVDNTNL